MPRAETWKAYRATRSTDLRDQLVLRHASMVGRIAHQVAASLTSFVVPEDLTAAAALGLIDAVEKFDETRGVRFGDYAARRMRGAVIDEIRALDWVSRVSRKRARDIERAVADLEGSLERSATPAEVADRLGIPEGRVHEVLDAAPAMAHFLSLDRTVLGGGDDGDEGLEIEDRGPGPADYIDLRRAVLRLPPRERAVVTMHYYEGRFMREIAAVLGVVESRVSQIHGDALVRLRRMLDVSATVLP